MKAERVALEIQVLPDCAGISMARRVVDDLSTHTLNDADAGWRLAMAAHELLDNARKYGRGGAACLRFDIESVGGRWSARVRVESRGSTADTETLRNTVAEIAAAKDAWACYLTAMRRTAERAHGSGLGLTRISAEGGMRVTASIDGDLVSIAAELAYRDAASIE